MNPTTKAKLEELRTLASSLIEAVEAIYEAEGIDVLAGIDDAADDTQGLETLDDPKAAATLEGITHPEPVTGEVPQIDEANAADDDAAPADDEAPPAQPPHRRLPLTDEAEATPPKQAPSGAAHVRLVPNEGVERLPDGSDAGAPPVDWTSLCGVDLEEMGRPQLRPYVEALGLDYRRMKADEVRRAVARALASRVPQGAPPAAAPKPVAPPAQPPAAKAQEKPRAAPPKQTGTPAARRASRAAP